MRKIGINEREMQIFEENFLPGFFHPKMKGKHCIVYTAPLTVPLKAYIKKKLTVHNFYHMLAQIVEMVKKIDIYKLYLYNLILDVNIIFVKETTGELFFLYEPLMNRNSSTNVFAFLGDLIGMIKTEDKELNIECKKFQEFINNPEYFKIQDIESYIMEHYPQIYQQVFRADKGKSGFITSNRLNYQKHYNPSYRVGENEQGTVLLHEDEGTVLLHEEEGTVLLNEYEQMPKVALIRKKNGEHISIVKKRFSIGKNPDNDYVITDNKAISRTHVLIACSSERTTITDQGSTNRTYVNGKILEPNKEEEIRHRDTIQIADEEFEFLVD